MVETRKQTRLRAFRRQVDRLERRLVRLECLSRRFSAARLATVVVGIPLIAIIFRRAGELPSWIALGLGLVLFLVLIRLHQRLTGGIVRHTLWRQIKLLQIARMNLDWPEIPLRSGISASAEHPYATDLNLVGHRSLHQLVDTAMSVGGSERLLGWFLHGTLDPGCVAARQRLVRELVPMSIFRDRLALAGARVAASPRQAWNGESLMRWLEEHRGARSLLPWLLTLAGLAIANAILIPLSVLAGTPHLWLITMSAYLGVFLYKHREYEELFVEAEHLQHTLGRFGAVMQHLETCSFGPAHGVEQLCRPFREASIRPSRELGRIAWLVAAAGLQRNQILWLMVNLIVPWDLFFAHRLNRCKERLRAQLPTWLDVWYELEGLNSLASFAYLNPGFATPEVRGPSAPEEALVAARDLGHPLLPDAERVCNSFALERQGDIVIITGSNMSGKSTFLRTLGVNLCLAFAGGVVCAAELRTIPLRLFTCIQVQDSVTDGISYFYAEVRRLKALITALQAEEPVALLYLIDEIFRGTNNRERLIGTRAYVQALSAGHGVGVISTHDLELVKLSDKLPRLLNYHFREEVIDGRMIFDYQIHSGPCPTTNALKIMQMEGLPI